MDIRGGEEDFQQTNGRTATGHLSSGVGPPVLRLPALLFGGVNGRLTFATSREVPTERNIVLRPPEINAGYTPKKPTAPAGTMGRSAHRKCMDV